MDFFDCLRLVLGVLLVINHFIYILFEPKSDEKRSIDKSKNQEQTSKMDIPLLVINIGSLLVIMGICLFAFKTQKPSWLFLLMIVMGLAIYTSNFFSSIDILADIVKETQKGVLSYHEQFSVMTISSIVLLIDFLVFEKLAYIDSWCVASTHWHDFLVAAFFIGRIYLLSFMICAMLSVFIRPFLSILSMALQKVGQKEKALLVILQKKLNDPFMERLYVLGFWRSIKEKMFKVLAYLLVPIAITFDMLAAMFCHLLSIIYLILFSVVLPVYKINGWVLRLCMLCKATTDRKVIAFAFRISFVISFLAVVIMNRASSMFKNADSSTAILEFVASVIIIPLVFEWINSFRESKTPKS